ncbi:hypothetical protein [Streptomyces sp. TRM72054]|uniref:putative quinol monooxygenase n=1 Tax=Streptomyces sp. TRM72054 TaxID=2870562 RepID=UPI0027DF9C70|nr:hypothetical protein [Streptomyces sp. TRM72054]
MAAARWMRCRGGSGGARSGEDAGTPAGKAGSELLLHLHQQPCAYWIFEVYRDEDAFKAHLVAPYGAPFNAALTPLIEEDASVPTFLDPLATHP